MNTARCAGILALLGAIAIGVVHLRAEQARVTSSILSRQSRRVALRRTLWAAQVRVAILRTPDRIHARLARWTSTPGPTSGRTLLAARTSGPARHPDAPGRDRGTGSRSR